MAHWLEYENELKDIYKDIFSIDYVECEFQILLDYD